MKSRRNVYIYFSVIISAFLLTSMAHAERKRGGILRGIKDILPCPYVLLNHINDFSFSDDQVTKIKELKYSSQKARAKIHAEIKILEIELQELLDMKSVDKGKAEEKIDALGKLYIKKAKDCVDNRLNVKKLLTDEQLKKWETFRKRDYGLGYGHRSWREGHEEWEGKRKKKMSGSDSK